MVAARDEETRIEGTVRRLLAQSGAEVEVIVVDDRSADGTTEILRRLAMEDERLRILRVDALPERWMGKCHACYLGANAASGEWILFTDADCWMRPDVIARALQAAARTGADHITITPGGLPETLGGRAWHVTFLISAASWISGVNRDRPKAYVGVGAFNFMRSSAYRACGGYEALRLTVVDDVKLGLLLQRAGQRTRAFIGSEDVDCHWGRAALSMIKIMEKNYFAVLEFRLALALPISFGGPLIWCAAIVGPFTGTLAGIAAGAALLTMIIPACVVAKRLGWPFASAFASTLIYPLMCYTMFRSVFVTLKQGGIRWRDTFYPLKMLREGAVR